MYLLVILYSKTSDSPLPSDTRSRLGSSLCSLLLSHGGCLLLLDLHLFHFLLQFFLSLFFFWRTTKRQQENKRNLPNSLIAHRFPNLRFLVSFCHNFCQASACNCPSVLCTAFGSFLSSLLWKTFFVFSPVENSPADLSRISLQVMWPFAFGVDEVKSTTVTTDSSFSVAWVYFEATVWTDFQPWKKDNNLNEYRIPA